MQADEEFINAEFFKFVNKLNRFLKSEGKRLIYFNFSNDGIVKVGIWNDENSKGNFLTTNINKGGAYNESFYPLSED
jgi:hypothetical protein